MPPDVEMPETPAPNLRRIALWLIAAAVTATVWGMAAAVFRSDGSSINSYLFLELGWPDATAGQVERILVAGLAVAALVAWRFPHPVLLVPIAVYVLLEAVAGTIVRGYAFSDLSPAAHALRFLSPIAWWLLARSLSSNESLTPRHEAALRHSVHWLLRIGLALVFLTHGYEAWQQHAKFVDLILTTGVQWLGIYIEESTAAMALRVIGAIDIVVAVLLLIRPWPILLIWLAIWGAVTAASRLTSFGLDAYPDLLVRWTHFAVPIALLLLIRDERSVAPDAEPATLDVA